MDFVPHAERIRFILVEPSHPGNIGAAARAINTMGFNRLYVVNPRDKNYKENHDCVAYSTHSVGVIENSVCTETLLEALDGVNYAYALSGYSREFGPPLEDLFSATVETRQRLKDFPIEQIAFVFGTERSGLTNEQMAMCQKCVAIPANPECDSLNLAQAVQVTAYQLQQVLRGTEVAESAERFEIEETAPIEAVEGFFEHFEKAMIRCGALDPAKPKLMMPRMRKLFTRAQLTQSEVDILRGICSSIIEPKELRKGRKKPSQN